MDGGPSERRHSQTCLKLDWALDPSFPPWTNLMDSVPAPLPSESLQNDREGDLVMGPPSMWRLYRNGVAFIGDFLFQGPRPGALFMDTFSTTLSTTKSLLSIYKHRRFLGYGPGDLCVVAEISVLILFSTSHFLRISHEFHQGNGQVEKDGFIVSLSFPQSLPSVPNVTEKYFSVAELLLT